MAFEKIGLGLVLEFNAGSALKTMGNVNAAFATMATSASMALKGVGMLGRSFGALGLAMAPFTAMVGLGVDQAAKFEQAMADVGAVLTDRTAESMAAVTNKAKEMGATTVFTATQSAGAMQNLARQGFNAQQIIAGIGGVMDAAAADGMSLSMAADVVGRTIKGMGLEADQMNNVADVLAMTSARTATDITQLGDSLRYSMGQAQQLGIQTPQLIGTLGILADSLGATSVTGTSLTQALAKLAKPSAKAKKLLGGVSAVFRGGEMDIASTFERIASRISKIRDPIKRAAAQTEIFGIRGQKAFAALSGKKGLAKMRTLLQDLGDQMRGFKIGKSADGKEIRIPIERAAKAMAEFRLDTFLGRMTLVKSALEGFSLELFTPFLVGLKETAELTAAFVGGITKALMRMRSDSKEGFADIHPALLSLANGINDALNIVLNAVDHVRKALISGSSVIENFLGPKGLETVGKYATLFVLVGAALAPVLAGLATAGFVVSAILGPAVAGLGLIFSALAPMIAPALLVVGALAVAVSALKSENESLGQFFLRTWNNIEQKTMDFWEGVLLPMISGIKEGFLPLMGVVQEAWSEAWTEMQAAFIEVMELFSVQIGGQQMEWFELGKTIGKFAGEAALALGKFAKNVVWAFRKLLIVVDKVFDAFTDIASGSILTGLKKLGKMIMEALFTPLQVVARAIAETAKTLRLGHLVPAEVNALANLGFSGLIGDDPILPEAAKAVTGRAKAQADAQAKVMAKEIGKEVAKETGKALEKNLTINTRVDVDGRNVALATSKHGKEVYERSGGKTTDWQRRQAVEHGAVPMPSN